MKKRIMMLGLNVLIIMVTAVGLASGFELGMGRESEKGNSHVLKNQAWDRQGGEDMASATLITAIPYYDTGATCDNIDDYEVACPYDSTSPDVVYSFTPAFDISITVNLDGSGYDTKVFVLDAALNTIACNDDSHLSGYVSYIEEAILEGGVTYFIVVDGYGVDCGSYVLNIIEYDPSEPCYLPCEGSLEGEPAFFDGYVDQFNGGCNSPAFTLTDMNAYNHSGTLTFCGTGGWFTSPEGSDLRDTDWFEVTFGETGTIRWTVDAQSASNCAQIDITDCDNIEILQHRVCGPCDSTTITLLGDPFSVTTLFIGSTVHTQEEANYPSNEYGYKCYFTGLRPVATSVPESGIPQDFALGSCFPNPFNPQTIISFDLPHQAKVTMGIYDVSGQLIRQLIQGEIHDAGHREVLWSGTDDSGQRVASGIYFYRLDAGSFTDTKRMVMIK